MSWYGLEGHEQQVERFRRQLAGGRLSGSYLFVGPTGIGKFRFAKQLVQCVLCQRTAPDQLEACGQCPSCQQVNAETHPDFDVVCRPPDRSSIPLELLIGDREHRMREGLCHRIAMRPFSQLYRLAILQDADSLGPEGASSLLKTLEEPPPTSVVILIAHSELRQLPTIRSRCHIIRFHPLPLPAAAQVLMQQGVCTSLSAATDLARLGHGSLELARQLADAEVQELAQQLWAALAQHPVDWSGLGKQLQESVDATGKDLPPRRHRLRQIIWLASEFYRQLMRCLAAQIVPEADLLHVHVAQAAHCWPQDDQAAGWCLERCQEALWQAEANAHLPTLIDGWIEDLRSMTCHGIPTSERVG